MWSLLFCISSTSIFSRAIAARTAFQRRSSSAVEIGVFSRSDKAIRYSQEAGLRTMLIIAFGLPARNFSMLPAMVGMARSS